MKSKRMKELIDGGYLKVPTYKSAKLDSLFYPLENGNIMNDFAKLFALSFVTGVNCLRLKGFRLKFKQIELVVGGTDFKKFVLSPDTWSNIDIESNSKSIVTQKIPFSLGDREFDFKDISYNNLTDVFPVLINTALAYAKSTKSVVDKKTRYLPLIHRLMNFYSWMFRRMSSFKGVFSYSLCKDKIITPATILISHKNMPNEYTINKLLRNEQVEAFRRLSVLTDILHGNFLTFVNYALTSRYHNTIRLGKSQTSKSEVSYYMKEIYKKVQESNLPHFGAIKKIAMIGYFLSCKYAFDDIYNYIVSVSNYEKNKVLLLTAFYASSSYFSLSAFSPFRFLPVSQIVFKKLLRVLSSMKTNTLVTYLRNQTIDYWDNLIKIEGLSGSYFAKHAPEFTYDKLGKKMLEFVDKP